MLVLLTRSMLVAAVALALAGCIPQAGGPATPTPAAPTPTAVSVATKPTQPPPTPSAERPLVVTEPRAQQKVSSPVRVAGLAFVYEGTVLVEIADAQGVVLGQGFTTATAGAPEVGSFQGDIPFTTPPQAGAGVVRLYGSDPRSGERVGLVEIPVTLAAATASPATLQVQIYFSKATTNDIQFPSVTRTVPYTQAVARAALGELLKGLTEAEKQSGLGTSIPAGAQLKSVRIENGTAYADFDEKLGEGVGGSLRTSAIRQQITLTLRQFSTVKDVVISINGQTQDILQP